MIILRLLYFITTSIIDIIIFNISASALIARDQTYEDCCQLLYRFQKSIWTFVGILNEICRKSSMNHDIFAAFLDHEFTPEKAAQLHNNLKKHQTITTDQVIKMIQKYGMKPTTIKVIVNDTNSNHRSEVVQSCSRSIKKLDQRYHKTEISIIKDLVRFIEKDSEHNQSVKDRALLLIEKFKTNSEIHNVTGKTLLETLSLIYKATVDQSSSANPDGITLTDQDIKDRKENLVHNLYRLYIDRCMNVMTHQFQETCFMGMHNDIVASLDHCHVDVQVDSLSADILITPKLLEYVISELENCPDNSHIIENWFENDHKRDQWITSIQPIIEKQLLSEFGSVFPKDKIKDFTTVDVIDALPIQEEMSANQKAMN